MLRGKFCLFVYEPRRSFNNWVLEIPFAPSQAAFSLRSSGVVHIIKLESLCNFAGSLLSGVNSLRKQSNASLIFPASSNSKKFC